MDSRKDAPRGQLALVSFADSANSDALARAIQTLGISVKRVDNDAWLREPRVEDHVVVLLGSSYPRTSVLSLLRARSAPRVLGAFLSAAVAGDEELFSACVDFFGWPCHIVELSFRITRLFDSGTRACSASAEADVLDECLPLQMLGRSPTLLSALEILRKFARCEAPLLILGETGTGKELAARAVHYVGARRDHPFIAVNCGAIPDNLLENELFGHERGAYTDAREQRTGLVERAHHGTLFLDEVDALTDKGQVTLLRFLQDHEYRPLGGRDGRKSDARVIAATNADLGTLVRQGRFRKDLLFRLQVLTVTLPPLREREGDVALLAEHFLRLLSARYGQGQKMLAPETLAWMAMHAWTGNVRELENLLHRHYLLADGPVIHIPEDGAHHGAPVSPAIAREVHFREAKAKAVATFERAFLEALLVEAGGNISLAARRAGKDRSAFRRLLHKHGLQLAVRQPAA
ncbi:sigma-54 interaction domain-containing protein [Paraburkholderia caribensis]|uniref:sigma-54 interaction domain-containing protein n=1 Tax=Paraburkholderia caribensis TaxID=75105 RepID=UPI001D095E89|nr:sigma-54 dependent transcriptional regulator [Paraburkholderia caribensis]